MALSNVYSPGTSLSVHYSTVISVIQESISLSITMKCVHLPDYLPPLPMTGPPQMKTLFILLISVSPAPF